MAQKDNIFVGYRSLGSIADSIPLNIRYIERRKENLIVTCVGKVFHTYGSTKLRILSVSRAHPDDINCLTSDKFIVFTGCQNVIRAWKRGVDIIKTFQDNCRVEFLLPFGPFLISVNEENVLKLWEIQNEEMHLELNFDKNSFMISALMHPNGLENKILLGSEQGRLQLWNINTSQLIYTFNGWDSKVCVIVQAPRLNVVAIGLENGKIMLHNLLYDETVLKFQQDWGPVTGISFRSDDHPFMATGSVIGHIAVWNIHKKTLAMQIRDAHRGLVAGLQFLPGEPVLVTSSPDNSLKLWKFDESDSSAQILKERIGHNLPPTRIRFYGDNGENILSAGQDSTLKVFSTVADLLHRNMGTASLHQKTMKRYHREDLKLPPIVQFDAEVTREREWDNIVACHRKFDLATVWSFHKGKMGEHKLIHERFKKETKKIAAKCVAMTACGNYAIIGYESGHVDMFNVQSGLYRGSFGEPKAHKSVVQGVVVDGLNQITVTGGVDQDLKFWKFKSKEQIHKFEMKAGIAQLVLHRENGLLSVALDDFNICIVDIETRKVVRTLTGHTNIITDMCYSPESYWLLSASMDSTIRTWDLVTGCLIDCFLVSTPCTSLTMSPTSDFLATSHVDELAVFLWANKTIYSRVNLRPLPEDYEPVMIGLPTAGDKESDAPSDDDTVMEEINDEDFKSVDQISDQLVTLALLPHSRWHNLLMLDVIKARNKPKAPPEAPKRAPFFIPILPGLEVKFKLDKLENTPTTLTSKVLDKNPFMYTEFEQFLHTVDTENYSLVIDKLKSMGPSAIDLEIRSLSQNTAAKFLNVIAAALKSNRDFEAVQAYLGLFLKIHYNVIADNPQILENAKYVSEIQKDSWERVQKLFHSCLDLVNFLKNAPL